MKKVLKKIIYNLAFTPQFSPFHSKTQAIKPYWGVILPNQIGGPVSRTKRMIKAFGQYKYRPNIIHVNSAWDPEQFKCALRMKERGLKIVFNQNGHYYPAWYQGNFKAANQAMIDCQKAADFVIFQSEFSKKTQQELTGYTPPQHMILHNAVPYEKKSLPKKPEASQKKCLLTGVFGNDSEHILRPALMAFDILSERKDCPRLIIAGKIQPSVLESSWFKSLAPLIQKLEQKNLLLMKGEYSYEDYNLIIQDMDFALHLKYKDCCPNAVIEKMLSGIPFIFSDSGGTPELIGPAGIPLKVKHTWDEMVPVEPKELAQAVTHMVEKLNEFKEKAIKHSELHHSWDNYMRRYQEVFDRVLSSP